MSTENKAENNADKLGGKVKEGLGKLTGDKHAENEGKTQAGKADAKNTFEDAKDSVTGTLDGLKNDKN